VIADRKFQLVGPYADIHRDLMRFPADWVPPPIDEDDDGDEDMPFYEISLEGPAGTGKTFFEGVLLEDLHQRYPRLRSVVIRKTRVSLTDSFMQVFEDDVLQADHPAIARKISRANRQEYRWTATVNDGGGVTRLAGMDNPTRLFSTQYDLIIVVEAIEFTEDEYQSLFRAMRNTGAPFKAIILDTNPGNSSHWLNRRPDKKGSRLRRVRTKHRHNPAYVNPRTGKLTARGRQYMDILDQYSGVARKRMRDGIWCSAEGVIWDNFDPDAHVVKRGKVTKDHPHGENLPDFEYFIGSLDLGWFDATVLQMWGVTADRRMFRVAEWYGHCIEGDTLASWLIKAHQKYDFVRCVSDHRPEVIHFLNERLGWRGKNHSENLVMKAQKGSGSVEAGLLLVRDLLGDYEKNKASKIFFVENSTMHNDLYLKKEGLPISTEEEILGYVWSEQVEGKPAVNKPDPGCIDHGCDSMRYGVVEIWKSDFRSKKAILANTPKDHWNSEAVKSMNAEQQEKWLAENDL